MAAPSARRPFDPEHRVERSGASYWTQASDIGAVIRLLASIICPYIAEPHSDSRARAVRARPSNLNPRTHKQQAKCRNKFGVKHLLVTGSVTWQIQAPNDRKKRMNSLQVEVLRVSLGRTAIISAMARDVACVRPARCPKSAPLVRYFESLGRMQLQDKVPGVLL
jgi:hypothetical protein